MKSEELDELWLTYQTYRDVASRNKLVEEYYMLVKRVAGKVSQRLPAQVEYDDLVSHGVIGLFKAIEAYDADLGDTFEPYAVAKIRGAILDELRSLDWAPRSLRRRQREVETAYLELEISLGREPTDPEIAVSLGKSSHDVQLVRQSVQNSYHHSLDEIEIHTADSRYEFIPDESADPLSESVVTLTLESFKEHFDKLSALHRLILCLYYYEGLTLSDVGKVVGLTEGRMSQVHTRLVYRLRQSIAAEVS